MGNLSLEVVKTEVGSNGVRDFHLRVVDDDGAGNIKHGPIEIHSIELGALRKAHGGSYETFLLKVKENMILRYESLLASGDEADGLVGKKL